MQACSLYVTNGLLLPWLLYPGVGMELGSYFWEVCCRVAYVYLKINHACNKSEEC